MTNTDFERKTRSIFHKLHVEHANRDEISSRIRRLVSTEYLGLPKDFFTDKYCADLGCGSAALGTYNLLDLGARFVCAMDLNDSIIGTASAVLGKRDEFAGRWRLDIGSLAGLPYEDNHFDFVLCQGVIHHVEDDAKALREIHRVLKASGKANLLVHGKGGLMNRLGMELMRDEYFTNPEFKTLVDEGFSPEWFAENLNWLIGQIEDDGSENYRKSVTFLECLRDLIDTDLILTIRDRLQAPKYNTYTEDDFETMLRQTGFSSWYRVSRRPTYSNIRKVLAPLYHEYRSPLAKLLYGDGMLGFVVTK